MSSKPPLRVLYATASKVTSPALGSEILPHRQRPSICFCGVCRPPHQLRGIPCSHYTSLATCQWGGRTAERHAPQGYQSSTGGRKGMAAGTTGILASISNNSAFGYRRSSSWSTIQPAGPIQTSTSPNAYRRHPRNPTRPRPGCGTEAGPEWLCQQPCHNTQEQHWHRFKGSSTAIQPEKQDWVHLPSWTVHRYQTSPRSSHFTATGGPTGDQAYRQVCEALF